MRNKTKPKNRTNVPLYHSNTKSNKDSGSKSSSFKEEKKKDNPKSESSDTSGLPEVKYSDNDKGLDIIINSRITTKDIRDNLWRCRDFELSHLWQRSIFLNTLLVLCFSGYGFALMDLIKTFSKMQIDQSVLSSAYTINNVLMIICLVSTVFSCFCIMMSKGSKAWYEKYEHAINAFEGNEAYVSQSILNSGEKEGEKEGEKISAEIGGFQYANIKGYEYVNIEYNIFSCRAGAYSPSRINIAIGQVSFILWCIAFVIHFFLAVNNFQVPEWLFSKIPYLLIVVFGGVIGACLYVVLVKKDVWIKSEELLNEKKHMKKNRGKKRKT